MINTRVGAGSSLDRFRLEPRVCEVCGATFHQAWPEKLCCECRVKVGMLAEFNKDEPDQTIKADAGKPRLSLVPSQIVRDIAEVREYGNRKYGDSESWKRVELVRYIDALYRHMLAFVDKPESVDPESGIEHYKHAACNMAFICEKMRERHADGTENCE